MAENSDEKRKKREKVSLFLAFLLVIALTLLVGKRTFDGVQQHEVCPATWDEAVHLLPVLQLSSQLQQGDYLSFWRLSYAQDEIAGYPFFHSWITVSPFTLLPATLTLGRALNVLLVVLSVGLAFLLAVELSPTQRTSWLTALVGAGLVLTAMPLWAFASRVFLEPLGLLLTLAVLFCYLKAKPGSNGRFWLLGTSFLTALALFTKYSFGLFLIASLFFVEAIQWVITRHVASKRWLYLFGPFTLLALIWFANGDKLRILWQYSRSQDATLPLWSLESLTFYMQSLVQVYALGWLAIGLVLLGIAYAVYHFGQHRYRAVLVYLLVSLVSITLVAQKDHRFAYTVAPVALILGGVGVAWLYDTFRYHESSRFLRFGAIIALIVLLALGTLSAVRRFSYLQAAQEVVYQCPPDDIRLAYGFVLENSLFQGNKPHILNDWHRFNQYGLMWQYATNQSPALEIDRLDLASGSLAPAPTEEALRGFVENLRQQNVGLLVSVDGSPAGTYTGWQTVEPLWGQGDLEWLDSSEPYRIVTWSDKYQARALGGNFRGRDDFERAREEGLEDFEIQLHLYSIVTAER